MKFKINIIFILACITSLTLLFLWQYKKPTIEILYDNAIKAFSVETLKSLRSMDAEKKQKLFASFEQNFLVSNLKEKIAPIHNPQIILWFADHFGRISQDNALWYKQSIIEPLRAYKPTFWFVDLAAWRLLSINEQKLLACPDAQNFLKKQSQGKNALLADCSLVNDKAAELAFPENIPWYKTLRANDFFIWLDKLPFYRESILHASTIDLLVRKDIRCKKARFSLRQLGYQPTFLDSWSNKLEQNLLDADHTQIFPLLQFLEGVYYALTIIEDAAKKGLKECNIVFLLPNKEFTYYMAAAQEKPFATFKRTISSFVRKDSSLQKISNINIYFYPFSYGKDFYDQPFEQKGPALSNNELINLLTIKK